MKVGSRRRIGVGAAFLPTHSLHSGPRRNKTRSMMARPQLRPILAYEAAIPAVC